MVQLSQKRVQAREVILDGGKKVHRVLEQEAAGPTEEIKVKVDKREEWWALRILNMIVSLETLIDSGLTVRLTHPKSDARALTCPAIAARDSCLRFRQRLSCFRGH